MTSSHPLSKNNLGMLFPALVALGALAAAELTPAERVRRNQEILAARKSKQNI